MIHDLDEFKNIPVDYDSPIKIVVNQMADEIARFTEDGVMQAVVKAGFYIDKDKFVSILQQDRKRYNEAYLKGYKDRGEEIVRCKDCKHFGRYYAESKNGVCNNLNIIERSEYWFCADGERRDNDGR